VLRPSPLPHVRALVAEVARLTPRLTARLTAALSAAVLLVVAGGLSFLAFPGQALAAAAPADSEQPLVPRIGRITPDYVPDHGPIRITGTVTNASDERWTAINVHGFMGEAPMRTASALAVAAQTPLDADVGHRITAAGTFASIGSLAPGETAAFDIKLPRSRLPISAPGVYWFGVHVLGDNGQGGTRVAVGRDRTFLPYVPSSSLSRGEREATALVVPVRAGVSRGSDGTIVDPGLWATSLRSGPLHDAVALGRAARHRPLTFLVDPAVPDAVRRIAEGNPGRTLVAPEPPGPGDGSQSPSPSASPSESGSSAAGAVDTGASSAPARVATRWLVALRQVLSADTSQVLGLPYGDVAVEDAASFGTPLLRAAYAHTGHSLKPWGVPLVPVAAPPDGRTTGDTIATLPHDTQVLLDDTGVVGQAPAVARVDGRRVVLVSAGAAEGGPGPRDPQTSLALRQRILAEAAVRLIGERQPLVVELPTDLHRPPGAGFFAGLDVPWLRLTTLAGATAAVTPSVVDDARLRPPSQETHLGPHVYAAARDVLRDASTLQSVLTRKPALRRSLFEEVAGNTSYAATRQPLVAFYRLRATDRWIRSNLGAIHLVAPPSVTLASTSGRFSALVSNDLDVPVTVRVRAVSDRGLHITGGERVELAPHGRNSVLLNASTHDRGVHNVALELTNRHGKPLGAVDTFPMRAEQVSGLIWAIIGAGVALLFAAIVVRLFRRILRDRRAGA
jgi:Family of unknown function (DUF6049)